jgi:hypothetical protein
VTLTGDTVKAAALHEDAVIAVIAGTGLMVTVTVKLEPTHPPDVGVTVYVAVCGALVGFVKFPLMLAAAVPAAPPVRPPVTTGAAQV